jgi:S1-C subfamily serine protease
MKLPRCLAAPGLALALVSAVTAPSLHAAAGLPPAAGRKLMTRYADAVVGVELVVTLKVKVGDREAPPREQRVDVNGTVISADGLTVTSLAEVDPQASFEAMRAAQGGAAARVELLGAEFKEVKLRLADGSEVPARFALKDADLDLAFMLPDEDPPVKRTFAFVDLDKGAEGEVLGEYFVLSRAPKALQRVPVIRRTEVAGVVARPRKLYILTEQALGTPVLTGDGRPLGISLLHFANGRRTGLMLRPAADIAEIARQVSRAKPAPKAEEKAEPPPVATGSAAEK